MELDAGRNYDELGLQDTVKEIFRTAEEKEGSCRG